MKYVYILQSLKDAKQRYIGVTTNLNERLKDHNTGKSPHTAKFKPWQVVVAIRFANNQKADAFGKYLKSGSGHAFAKHHFW